MNRKFFQQKYIFLFVITLLLLGGLTWTVSGETPLRSLLAIKGEGKPVVYVNGEPISRQSLEQAKFIITQNVPSIGEKEAYQQALESIIRNTVLIQEAKKRGITVSKEEALQYWEQIQSQAKESPELQSTIEEFKRQTDEGDVVNGYRQALLVQKLDEKLSQEAPKPTESEVDLYLARNPGQNTLALIPIFFDDSTQAKKIFGEIQASSRTESKDTFIETFDEKARELNGLTADSYVHQTFAFTDPKELPDYAQDALSKPENQPFLFMQPDGKAVIYVVLMSDVYELTEIREMARQTLMEEKQQQYIDRIEQELIRKAQITLVQRNLPDAAKDVTLFNEMTSSFSGSD